MATWQEGGDDFTTRLEGDPELGKKIGRKGLRDAGNAQRHLRYEKLIHRRCGL